MLKRTSLACILSLQMFSAGATAEVFPVAGLANPISNNGASARAQGMGSAFVSVADDSAALFWNPAGLSGLKNAEIALHHNSWLAGIIQETVVLGLPLASLGGLGLEINYINYGTLNSYDTTGARTGNYTPGRYGLGAGWGLELFEDISVGASLKGLYETIGDDSYSSVSLDLGAMWIPVPDFRVGFDISSLGTRVAGYARATDIRTGASYRLYPITNHQLLLAAALSIEPNGVNRLHLGAEDLIKKFLALRLGYQATLSETEIDGFKGLTAGIGIGHKAWWLDYALLPYGDLGTTHRISLTYKFGKQSTFYTGYEKR